MRMKVYLFIKLIFNNFYWLGTRSSVAEHIGRSRRMSTISETEIIPSANTEGKSTIKDRPNLGRIHPADVDVSAIDEKSSGKSS